ncbi:cbb3-type cytochrome c oxidase N-terminal domain-containing protein [Mucilaginibacter flavidus]|uniref:cbb3-type cytochrome c oxidase N-terminal domain-containing protein n=1 Tax=Mucilaginibacter flavidus TaxID=2949309 RepID=UPI002092DFAB|nr:cbb3-type cytochrome c oxidase N-terminal domain-containing protein [Mucilaginibacter flavidus]MCO5948488.1 c-type cytochrome [Mucilaginibacter flavidus]
MKYLRIIFLLFILISVQPVTAAADSLLPGETMDYIGYGAIIAVLLLLIIAMLVLLKAFKVLTRVVLKSEGYTNEQINAELEPAKKEKKPKAEVWQKLLSLRPMAEEKELLIAHDYDGIEELDNPIPAWFMWLFYSTIVFAVCYLLIYHVFNAAPLQYQEYKIEMAQADIAKKVFLSKAANRVDENSVKLVQDPATLASGKAIFMSTCAPCHGEHAQGNVGPNLTDDYWLHGNKINDLFKTIKYGVLAKGMPTWEKQLSPKQISDVANYIKSLHGTNPAGAKEPQGTKEIDTDNKIAANK